MASVVALRIPEGADAECLVIDNASIDDTAAIVDQAATAAPFPLRRFFEPRLGVSFARNRAIAEARGRDFIFFLDDDVIAEPDWASELLGEIERRNLDAACGLVLPRWPAPPPRWLGTRILPKLAVHDQTAIASAPASELESLRNYFSANVGLRCSALERCGGFREDLGVVGGNPLGDEDTELFARIIARGGAMGFARRAIAHHVIPPERLTRRYFRRKSFAFGVSSGYARGRSHNHLDKLIRNALRMMMAAARGDPAAAFYHQLECINFFGYWRGRASIFWRSR